VPPDRQELWAAPIHFSTNILFYNKSIFDKAGVPYPRDDWTWDDMVQAAQKLTKRDAAGRITQFGLFLPEPMTAIMGNGGREFNDDFSKCVIDSPRTIEAIERMRDLRFKYKVAPDPSQVQGTSSTQMFKLGQLAMLPGRTWMTVDFNKITDFQYDVALSPPMRTRVERVAVGGMAMSRRISPRQKEAAWRWMKFFTSKAGGQKLLGKEKNCVTAVEEYAWSPKYFMQAPPQHCRPYVTSLKAAVLFMPPIVGASEYSAAISNPMMDDMLRDPKANIPAMLKAYQDAANALLKHEPTTSSPLVR
jgi:multiple sugar transport system substrate-binding protein